MMYRAKITKIINRVEGLYNTERYHLVRDSRDTYIEVPSEDEAYFLEAMNSAQGTLLTCEASLRDLIEQREDL